jgi:hypothetical protein
VCVVKLSDYRITRCVLIGHVQRTLVAMAPGQKSVVNHDIG